MSNKIREGALGAGAQRGWKSRQNAARHKMLNPEARREREKIRAQRKALRDGTKKAKPEQEPQPETEPKDAQPTATEANAEKVELKPVAELNRDELFAELAERGVKASGNSKDATLRKKLLEARPAAAEG